MKRKSNNSGRRVRSQEEIDARREARRKYYEEMEAFERDLPDFIFADEQTDNSEAFVVSAEKKAEEPETAAKTRKSKKAGAAPKTEKSKKAGVAPKTEKSKKTGAAPKTGKTKKSETVAKKDKKSKKTGTAAGIRIGAEEIFGKIRSAAKTAKTKVTAKVGVLSAAAKNGITGQAEGAGKEKNTKSRSGRRFVSKRQRRRRWKKRKPLILAACLAIVVLAGGGLGFHALGIIGGRELYEVYVNDTLVGKVEDPKSGRDAYLQVRREVVSNSESMVLMEADCEIRKVETLVKIPSKEEELQTNMKQVLEENIVGTLDKAYTVKINDYIVNLQSKDEVVELLDTVKNPYDEDGEYTVQLVADTSKELTGLTTQIVKTSEDSSEIAAVASADDSDPENTLSGSDSADPVEEEGDAETEETASTDDLPESTGENDGLKGLSFVENIEIAESYVSSDSISTLDQAVEDVTKEKEESQVYEVSEGDCLSVVAEKNNMTTEKLLELNEDLQEDTVLQIGDEIVVTNPEPELSVMTQEEVSYEEDYEEPVQYIDNDSWYTTKEVVQQEATTGHRKVTALVTYKNGKETGREIIAQTVVTAAQPKIIERGTQAPPTYVKPISGGRYSSGYGKRWGKMHKGVDWACSVGTAVRASCGGTVVSAGWANGYGYCITIKHPDGKQTRYAHLSKILVSAGKTVKQGDKIALSGNTGRSTGPHLHFEILVNGSQVNPLKYLN